MIQSCSKTPLAGVSLQPVAAVLFTPKKHDFGADNTATAETPRTHTSPRVDAKTILLKNIFPFLSHTPTRTVLQLKKPELLTFLLAMVSAVVL